MQIGLIGLGRMGFNLALILKSKGYEVVAYDRDEAARNAIAGKGIRTVASVEDLTLALASKRVIWLMIADGDLIDQTIQELKFRLAVSDILIDGSNSFYQETFRRAKEMEAIQIDYLDCGIIGTGDTLHDVCAMIGGNRFAFNYCEKIFSDIAVPEGYLYCGTSGAGHFVKMIHSSMEGGMTETIPEGFERMRKSEFKLDLEKIAKVWSHGSAIRKIQ